MGPGGRGDFHRVLKNHGDTWKIPGKMVAFWDKTLSRDFLPRCITVHKVPYGLNFDAQCP